MAAMARTYDSDGAGGHVVEQSGQYTYIHVDTHGHKGSVPYHVAMKRDTGPRSWQ